MYLQVSIQPTTDIKTFKEGNPEKFQKAKLEFADCEILANVVMYSFGCFGLCVKTVGVCV